MVKNKDEHVKVLRFSFWSVDFIHRLKSYNCILNKEYHVKELLKRFHLNGHTIGFHPQTQKLELHTK